MLFKRLKLYFKRLKFIKSKNAQNLVTLAVADKRCERVSVTEFLNFIFLAKLCDTVSLRPGKHLLLTKRRCVCESYRQKEIHTEKDKQWDRVREKDKQREIKGDIKERERERERRVDRKANGFCVEGRRELRWPLDNDFVCLSVGCFH